MFLSRLVCGVWGSAELPSSKLWESSMWMKKWSFVNWETQIDSSPQCICPPADLQMENLNGLPNTGDHQAGTSDTGISEFTPPYGGQTQPLGAAIS